MTTTEIQDGRTHGAHTWRNHGEKHLYLSLIGIIYAPLTWWGVRLSTRCWLIVKIVSPAALQQTHTRLCHWLPQQRPLEDEPRIQKKRPRMGICRLSLYFS